MKVLIIDDESLVRRSLNRAFSSSGDEVFEAEDGIKGIEMWKSEKPDLVLLDVLMPELSGPEVLKKMQDRLGAKVIMMSAYSGNDVDIDQEELKYDTFISKPFEDIFEIVNKAKGIVGG